MLTAQNLVYLCPGLAGLQASFHQEIFFAARQALAGHAGPVRASGHMGSFKARLGHPDPCEARRQHFLKCGKW
jgi:hypothetical protein